MKKIIALLLALTLAFAVSACGPKAGNTEAKQSDAGFFEMADLSGTAIRVPKQINSIVVLAPAIAEMVVGLDCGGKVIGYDTQSSGLEGLPEGKPTFDLMSPDMEMLMGMKPDVLFVSNMTYYDQEDPFRMLIDQGVCVVSMPSADTIDGIKRDLTFVATVLGMEEKGEELANDLQKGLDDITLAISTVSEKKRVYFELSAAPDLYSFGSGVFLNEMLELIGAENILANQTGWLKVDAETVVAANPDVILTNVNYIADPVGEILSRGGWDTVSAVRNRQVYYIDNMASSLANQNVIIALEQMAKAVYPECFQ